MNQSPLGELQVPCKDYQFFSFDLSLNLPKIKEFMSRITPRDFIGTRCRMHRLRDARIFHGWIQTMFGSRVEVLTPADAFVQIGEKFRFELHGRKTSAVFDACLTDVEQFDVESQGVEYAVEGSAAKVVEAEWIVLQFNIDGQFRYANALQPFRIRTTNIEIKVIARDWTCQATSVDVSMKGIAILHDQQVEPGQKVKFEAMTPLGKVMGEAIIRQCQKAKGGKFRLGLQLCDLGRLDKPRWERLITEL